MHLNLCSEKSARIIPCMLAIIIRIYMVYSMLNFFCRICIIWFSQANICMGCYCCCCCCSYSEKIDGCAVCVSLSTSLTLDLNLPYRRTVMIVSRFGLKNLNARKRERALNQKQHHKITAAAAAATIAYNNNNNDENNTIHQAAIYPNEANQKTNTQCY